MARGENNVRYAQAPPTKAASAVYVTLVAQVLSLGSLVIFEQIRGRRLAAQLAAFDGRPYGAEAEAVVGAVTVFAVLMMLVAGTTIAAAIAYATWLVRARQVNDRSAPSGPVAAALLVPGLNLVAPVVLVDEVWRGAHPPLDRRARWLALLGAWWVSWLATLALVVSRLLFGSSAGDLTGIGAPELTCLTLAALLCAATVRRITHIQRSSAPLATLRPARRLAPPSPESAPLGQTG
ncbi:DUF4328 domain-containing protein [Nonomuraea sp. NPDC048916]|uniref:DUF4328 domain-containing protein n=1 Tax=Nonomuraea sp. NPDC048916 TaxID=3154232 RepID=UPI0033C054FE